MIAFEGLTQTEAIRPYAASLNILRNAGLRPTRQRLSLAKLLFHGDEHRHVTAERLHEEAMMDGVKVSLATVYNTLHQFTQAGLLTELVVDSERTYFDTNTDAHHHFYNQRTGALYDIPGDGMVVSCLSSPPDGTEVKAVRVMVVIED